MRVGVPKTLAALALVLAGIPGPAFAGTPVPVMEPDDGWFDVSHFLDKAYGFVPIVVPVTEPALGYGAAGALIFIDKQKKPEQSGFSQPNITVLGGLATEDGSRGLFLLDSRHWRNDRLQTVVMLGDIDLHLDYYGLGGDEAGLRDHPLAYQFRPQGGRFQVKYRLGGSRARAGLAYGLAQIHLESKPASGTPVPPTFERESQLGGVTPSLGYDSRNNTFTPTRGIHAEALAGLYGSALGGSHDYQRVDLTVIGYHPLLPKVSSGVRVAGIFSFNDTPFYARPYVGMRGIEATRYQGERVSSLEAEFRWQFWKRISAMGFGGAGWTWSDTRGAVSTETVHAIGTGLRYELARAYGLHVGVDVAWGPDSPAWYLQFGSAWPRL